MNIKHKNEKGQTIVMIAVAIVGLIGFTALAIDGGNAFSDRRNAQNAADTAALSAALAKVRNNDWNAIGLTIATSNGYDNDTVTNTVNLYNPPIEGPYTGNNEYIQAVIVSHVDTFFAPVIGVEQMTNRVNSVARAKPSVEMFFGNAMVSLGQENDPQPVCEINGSAGGSVIGGGIFCNSSSNCAFDVDGGSGVMSIPEGVTVVGTACDIGDIGLGGSDITDGVDQLPVQDFSWLDPTCTGAVAYDAATHLSGNTVTPPSGTPLYFSGSFPPNPIEILNPGIYCLDDTFRVLNGTLTGTEVTIVMLSKGLTWNGGTINLTAPTSGDTAGLLIYQPPSNTSTMSIGGNVTLDTRGTFLAPSALISLAGGAHTQISGQLIGEEIDFTGSTGTTITYLDEENINFPPQIELTE